MSQYHLRWGGLASLICLFSTAISPLSARADVPLTQAEVQTFRNRVELLLKGGLIRPIRSADRVGFGDAIRTQLSSQADLQFNDNSSVRLGELTTFWFVPNTRELRLLQGTALLQIAAGSGSSVIETPNAITTAQNTAVVVRHIRPDNSTAATSSDTEMTFPESDGRTAVMVLAGGDGANVQVRLRDSRDVDLSVGQMAIVDNDNLYIFEFDLALFYETSPLIQDWLPETESAEANPAMPDAIAETSEFAGDYWLDPQFLSPRGGATANSGWLFPTGGEPSATTETDPDSTPASSTGETGAPAETMHDTSEGDRELAPNAPAAETFEEEMTAPNSTNTQNLDVPAGVLSPPPNEPAPPEQPTEPSNPLPIDPAVEQGEN